ncbi:MAG: manganese efflux pump, partial [Coprobacillus sp.]|nr:manganese efflux pump [Coprobacillus sp.]
IAFYFGFFQALMPFFGYHLGCVFSKLVQAYDHYIAFIFLMIV